jgi:hypothetical protein
MLGRLIGSAAVLLKKIWINIRPQRPSDLRTGADQVRLNKTNDRQTPTLARAMRCEASGGTDNGCDIIVQANCRYRE